MSSKVLVRIWDTSTLPTNWFIRQVQNYKLDKQLEKKIKNIIANVANNGDLALIELTERYDKTTFTKKDLLVSPKEVRDAYNNVDENQIFALKKIKNNVSTFESLLFNQGKIFTSMNNIRITNILIPIGSVGCYIPGGRASYPSTLIMTVIPAKVAGVSRIVVCSPPREDGSINPLVLVAADICGVDEIYKIGGAQAIAALAYGTDTIKPVKKIVGPGSKYIALAKILVSKDVAIDMPAGPSEVLIVADETANPKFIALDMISQAEHGCDSSAGLITTSEKLRDEVQNWLSKIVVKIDRSNLVFDSLRNYGFIITCESIDKAVELANVFAPEHLEIMTEDSMKLVKKFTSAGLILVGPFSPVALSDYGSGANHVLPTGGYGHVFSGLSSLDFARRVSIVEGSKKGLLQLNNQLKVMANAEDLPNHYETIKARFENG
ncbi:MAG: histidinol dehydrogenase [Candidatus Bathyarchaeota archaeon]|nr:histidinol dehydrogenase [Candidatus Bathyarchaeota archaeon]